MLNVSNEVHIMECLEYFQPGQEDHGLQDEFDSLQIVLCLQEVKVTGFTLIMACHYILDGATIYNTKPEDGQGEEQPPLSHPSLRPL